MKHLIRIGRVELMVSGRLAGSRKSGPGGPEVVHKRFDQESNRKLNISGTINYRLARSRKSGPGCPEVVNEKFDKELHREMDGFRQASQI